MGVVTLHSNRNPKADVGTQAWAKAVIGLAVFLFGIWIRKAVEHFKEDLLNHSSRL